MPVCTSCTHPSPYLYTVYGAPNNIRLEKCTACHEFVDPYVEHDSLTILLDLLLLKRGVYRHLIFNQGAEPRKVSGKTTDKVEVDEASKASAERDRWILLCQLGLTLVAVDAFIRWSYLKPSTTAIGEPWSKDDAMTLLRFFIGTAAETIAFHGGISLSCFIVMHLLGLFNPNHSTFREEFRLSMISMSLFYSSLTKFFLLLLLTIWTPGSSAKPRIVHTLPSWVNNLWTGDSDLVIRIFQFLDDDKLDREWIIRNVLGGMTAGFGLRVILDLHPALTSLIILIGWLAKKTMAKFVCEWVGGSAGASEAWLAYSIP
ncbi:Arv1-like family-domain-containing protein [Crepidotus variabilis]|uniref:Protein ARV n=1 Tax=Crepidotus variabilis TaxID=179855 RepID=A0A9P6E8D2_9AGAR|nr:Arv1-like family-domain-containing protein [Crepidotus variabilis]